MRARPLAVRQPADPLAPLVLTDPFRPVPRVTGLLPRRFSPRPSSADPSHPAHPAADLHPPEGHPRASSFAASFFGKTVQRPSFFVVKTLLGPSINRTSLLWSPVIRRQAGIQVRPGSETAPRRQARRLQQNAIPATIRERSGLNEPATFIVAIDGPAGAGKSTLASLLAKRFGLLNLETGAMYRAFARKRWRTACSCEDGPALQALTPGTSIRLQPEASGNRVFLDGRDVTSRIRDEKVTQAASRVSVHPPIRTWMVGMQRQLGANGGVVMEGRDIEPKSFLQPT